ncbi:MAG: hypothetical protein AB2A00_37555 [Myxococcota bacterium]
MRSLQLFLGSFLAGPAWMARWDAPPPSTATLLGRVPGVPALRRRRASARR